MKLFGTDGIRGKYNEIITTNLAFEIGQSSGMVLKNSGTKICIGVDTRISSEVIKTALIAGLISVGMEVTDLGIISTPIISYAIINNGFDYGVMVSASHNPYTDNGIKFFDKNAQKLSDYNEEMIEKKYVEKKFNLVYSDELKKINIDNTIKNNYIDYVISLSSKLNKMKLNKMKIALDCANGSASSIAPTIFEKLGATINVIGNNPNGININDKIGSTHTDTMSEYMRKNNFDLGFSYDGDADRIIMYSSNGDVLDGDYILYLLAIYYKENNKLNNNEVITTVMVNLGLIEKLKEYEIDIIKTKVGDRFVMQEITNRHATLGGEQSGHIIIPELLPTGDGILVSVILANIIMISNINTNNIKSDMKKFPQILVNKKVADKEYAMGRDELQKIIKLKEKEIGDNGRILVRASGTENLVRIMIEHKDINMCYEISEEIIKYVY